MSDDINYVRHLTIEEAEQQYTPKDVAPDRLRRFPQLAKPFGLKNDAWELIKSQIQPADEIWLFNWDSGPRAGGAGICLRRDGKMVAHIITLIS